MVQLFKRDYPLMFSLDDHKCPHVANDPNRNINIQVTVSADDIINYEVQTLKDGDVVSQVSLPTYRGLTDEVLLAIVLHRIGFLQSGSSSCDEYVKVWGALSAALTQLHYRTIRINSGEDHGKRREE